MYHLAVRLGVNLGFRDVGFYYYMAPILITDLKLNNIDKIKRREKRRTRGDNE